MPRKGGIVGRKWKHHKADDKKPPPIPISVSKGNSEFQERLQAEHAFIREGAKIMDIAKVLDRSAATVGRWAQEGGWESKRRAMLASKDGAADILERKLLQMLMEVEEGKRELSAPLADSILKITTAVDRLRGEKLTVTTIFAILNLFVAHVKAGEPSLLPRLEAHVESFLESRRKIALAGG